MSPPNLILVSITQSFWPLSSWPRKPEYWVFLACLHLAGAAGMPILQGLGKGITKSTSRLSESIRTVEVAHLLSYPRQLLVKNFTKT